MRQRHSPGLTDRRFSTRHGHGIEVGKTLEAVPPADQHFPAPDLPIRPVAGAVERETDHLALESMLGHAPGYVGMVVLHGDQAESTLARPLRGPGGRKIPRMQIVNHEFGFDLEGAHQEIERLAKELETS